MAPYRPPSVTEHCDCAETNHKTLEPSSRAESPVSAVGDSATLVNDALSMVANGSGGGTNTTSTGAIKPSSPAHHYCGTNSRLSDMLVFPPSASDLAKQLRSCDHCSQHEDAADCEGRNNAKARYPLQLRDGFSQESLPMAGFNVRSGSGSGSGGRNGGAVVVSSVTEWTFAEHPEGTFHFKHGQATNNQDNDNGQQHHNRQQHDASPNEAAARKHRLDEREMWEDATALMAFHRAKRSKTVAELKQEGLIERDHYKRMGLGIAAGIVVGLIVLAVLKAANWGQK